MGSSIDTTLGHHRRITVSGIRSLARSHRVIIAWPASTSPAPGDRAPSDNDDLPTTGAPSPRRDHGAPPHAVGRTPATEANAVVRLGALTILPGARTVLLNGVGIDIGSRAFDLLMVLVAAGGEIVSKETIMRRVWPTTTVIDSNLKVQLSILRRALGAERWRIKTVSGRGYVLVLDDHPAAEPQDILARPKVEASEPLIIVLDADRDIQRAMMQAIANLIEGLQGRVRIARVMGGGNDRNTTP